MPFVGDLAGAGQAASSIATSMDAAGETVGTTISAAMTAAGETVASQISAAMASGGAAGGSGGGSGGLSGLFSSLFGGGGAGAAAGDAGAGAGDFSDVADSIGFAHTGGLAGSTGMSRFVSPAAFIGAIRYHSGGVAGLKPNEVPTILQRNEEVLTESDPRHRFNQGMSGANGAPAQAEQPQNIKIITTWDHGEALSQALKTDVGEKAIWTHMRNNRQAYTAALGAQK